MNNWNNLTMAQKAELMNIYVSNGITNINDIKDLYNSFKYGGDNNKLADGGKGKPLFNKEKILNRIPGDALGSGGIGGPIEGVWRYFTNRNSAVKDRLDHAKEMYEKYKDKISSDPSGDNDETWNGLSMNEIEDLWLAYMYPSIKVHEDAKRIYLGYPQLFDSFEPSPNKPTIGKSDNPYQLNALLNDDEFEGLIFPAWSAWKKGDNSFIEPGMQIRYGAPKEIDVNRVEDRGKTALLRDAPHIEDATLSEGFDNKGQYISLYDIWDYNTKVDHTSGDNVGKWIGGKPFEIYQRYYLDDWLDIPEENRGNPYIAPAIITADKKADGGLLEGAAIVAFGRDAKYSLGGNLFANGGGSNNKTKYGRDDLVDPQFGSHTYYDAIKLRKDMFYDKLLKRGLTHKQIQDILPLIITQSVVESGYKLNDKNNNFGGMRYKGKTIKYDNIDDFANAYIDMLDEKFNSKDNSWRNAKSVDDWARAVNLEGIEGVDVTTEDKFNEYRKTHPDAYLYAPAWENGGSNYLGYKHAMNGRINRVKAYLDMINQEESTHQKASDIERDDEYGFKSPAFTRQKILNLSK